MKLTQNPLARLQNAERHFNQIESTFDNFVKRLDFFKEPSCPTRGVVVAVQEQRRAFVVTYKTVRLLFRLLLTLTPQGVASALVVCTWADQDDKGSRVELGRFAVDRSGRIDFEDASDGDQIDLEGMAPEIITHFLLLALERGAA